MKQTVTLYDFREAFRRMERNNFSYAGLEALFYYIEDLEDNIGEEIEFDVVALCCDYTEYDSMEDFKADYGDEYDSLEDVEEQTAVIRIPDSEGFIIQGF